MNKKVAAAILMALLFVPTGTFAEITDAIAISGTHPARDNGIDFIRGVATNESDRSFRDVFVTFNLLDPDDSLVGNARDHVQNLGPGEHWKFAAPATVKFSRYILVEVRAFP